MQKFNYHSHTKRCGHAIGEDEEYVLAAIANGYTKMGFSDQNVANMQVAKILNISKKLLMQDLLH